MRFAWLGPAPAQEGGANYVATQLLLELARRGHEIDCFVAAQPSEIPESLRGLPNLTWVHEAPSWKQGRWYSRTRPTHMISGLSARTLAQTRLAYAIRDRHAQRPYDLLYQFSQIELLAVRALRRSLPPIVLHPGTYAAGELRWLKAESGLAARCTPEAANRAVRAFMSVRAAVQRRDVRLAQVLLAVSSVFGEQLGADYGLSADRIATVRNPIDLDRHRPADVVPEPRETLQLLYVSRIAVRKGVEMMVELSRRLSGQPVHITIVGGHSLWSDYRCLLDDLDPSVAEYVGQVSSEEAADLYRNADVLLQPSLFEPFGLTIAEALATGVPVVASDEVGAVDGVDAAVCRTFANGDMDGFHAAVTGLLDELRSGAAPRLRTLARAEAERLFAPEVVTDDLERALAQHGLGGAAPVRSADRVA